MVLETPERTAEVTALRAKLLEMIARIHPGDMNELMANKFPQVMVKRVLYAVLLLTKENTKVFELDTNEKNGDPG